jgi:nitrogen fixation/metabolism regulation signal transduction histidine kinase
VNYIRSNYRQEQIAELEKKKQYIRNSLQDLYYWTEDIATVDEQSLNTNLQELAYRYQTDINIYDNAGKLRGSSQSLIFSKNLISGLMSPEVYFPDRTTENQYEQIGKLAYLAAYSDLINGDYLQIGYISIPQYFSQTEINAKIEQFLGAIIQIYLIIIILSIILILIAGRQLAEPLHQLESKLRSMRLGGKNEKIEYKSKDEIGQLVEQYNRTVDELEKSAQLLLTAERESAWRTMARQVAHEINNPLTPMKLTIQQLQRTKKIDPEQFDGYFEKAAHTLVEQIDNLSRIAGTFSQFARMPETKFTDVDIAGKLVSVVNLFQHNYENIRISYSGPENDIIVSGDPEQIIQVFNNILKNATQSIKKEVKGKIDVTLKLQEDTVIIRFTDNGTGISETIRNEIFKPNFTTKSAGMGLGLSISKSIIEHMGGHISFITKDNEGTTFEIRVNKKIK